MNTNIHILSLVFANSRVGGPWGAMFRVSNERVSMTKPNPILIGS